eukprot:5725614-Prymnesium_polylepis.1
MGMGVTGPARCVACCSLCLPPSPPRKKHSQQTVIRLHRETSAARPRHQSRPTPPLHTGEQEIDTDVTGSRSVCLI